MENNMANRPKWCPKCRETHDSSNHTCPDCGSVLVMYDE